MKQGRRVEGKVQKPKRKMTREEIEKRKKNIIRTFITIVALFVIFVIAMVVNNFIILDNNKTTNLVINNRNVTSNLKNEILIEDNIIYLSEGDISNFFDKYIYEDKETNQIITTYDKKIAAIGFNDNKITVNGSQKEIYAHAINRNGTTYLPISEMKDIYNIEIENIEDTKVITMDSLDREQKQAIVTSNLAVKSSTNFISKTVDRVNKGDTVIVVSSENGYSRVRTQNGKLGYIKTKKLENEFIVRENMEDEKQIEGKVNLTWDYFSQYGSAPDRSGTTIDGVNVVSPAFFYLDTDGELKENVGDEGQAYIEWAHSNGYKVWPMVANAEAARESLSITSEIMNSYTKRQELIEDIISLCVKYDLDGVNIDFENMKQEDKDMYSRFIIELTPRLKEIGLVTSVDVTAPDGGETWSLCFDRHVIGDVADYIIFMAYDQHGPSSKEPGTVAGYNWVETNIKKFLGQEDVDAEKIILGIPLYTRIWEEKDGEVDSKVVNMKDIESEVPEGLVANWDEELKQYYAEYQEDGATYKIWIENDRSVQEKINLANQYNLAGIAFWEKDREPNDAFWTMVKEQLN